MRFPLGHSHWTLFANWNRFSKRQNKRTKRNRDKASDRCFWFLSQCSEQIVTKTSEGKSLDKSISIIESLKLDSRWTIGLLWANVHITAFVKSSWSLNQTENCATFSPSGCWTHSYLHSSDGVVKQWISQSGTIWQEWFYDSMIKS